MEESDDDGEGSGDDEPIMGYGLHMTSILEACKASTTTTPVKRVVKGPAMPPKDFTVGHANDYDDEEDE
jgi:hypothetical protein